MISEMELKLDQLARELNVRVLPDLSGELNATDIAGWFPRSRRVLYRLGMSFSETICAIAHELGHAAFGDEYSEDLLRDSRQEVRADRWAVGVLISKSAYEHAERIVGSHSGALAAELDVTVEFVDIWKSLHEKAVI